MKRIDAYGVRIDMEATGENIKRLIKESGYKISEIQEMLHLQSVQSIYRWTKGNMPSIENLLCLSMIFEIPIEQIIVTEIDHFEEAVPA